eukprot:Hpha_TRINITY_DN34668_c0_g1::TRINITY_DN34668_c0_g1_i1::g.21120::m.21120
MPARRWPDGSPNSACKISCPSLFECNRQMIAPLCLKTRYRGSWLGNVPTKIENIRPQRGLTAAQSSRNLTSPDERKQLLDKWGPEDRALGNAVSVGFATGHIVSPLLRGCCPPPYCVLQSRASSPLDQAAP